jgi:hypothetical protein
MDKMISMCGLICTECPAFLATQHNNDDERKQTAEMWSKMYGSDVKQNDVNCCGCFSEDHKVFGYCKVCEIRKCGQEKDVKNCAHCADYPCAKLTNFFDMAPDAKTNLDEIRKNG